MAVFTGAGVAIATPFDENYNIDYESFGKFIDFQVENKTDAIIVCGTSGEASTLSHEEHIAAIRYCVNRVNKRIPVIAGTGSNNTSSAIEMSKYAESVGVDGLLVITPYYNKTTQKGLVKHFEAINNEVKTPIILYNVPSRTGVNIKPSTLVEIAKLNNVVAIKEASGDISQIAEIKALLRNSIDIYSGNDDQTVAIMSLGAKGVISVLANVIPSEVHKMAKDCLDGNFQDALQIQLDTLALSNTLFIETNPIPVKTAMNLMGMEVGPLRLPLCEMEDKNENALKDVLKANKLM